MIDAEHLEKTFTLRARGGMRRVEAVRDVSFRIAPGELVGYLGPNGAGKSTTFKMLTGLLVPSSGRLEVMGFVPWRDRRRYVARLGAVFGQRSTLWWDLPVSESLDLLRHIYRVPRARFAENLAAFADLLELGEFLHIPARALSLGQRMRADLCAAMLHDPPLLVLDEPTIGLDTLAKLRIREFVAQLNRERGTTVLLTTHDLADVARLCRRVLVIDRGRLLYDGALSELQARFGGERRLVVDFARPYQDVRVEGAEVLEHAGERAVYRLDGVSASEVIGRLSARFELRDLAVMEPDLEATVRAIYEGRLSLE
jgi:ABC-2 type transport system ATP-binding protein